MAEFKVGDRVRLKWYKAGKPCLVESVTSEGCRVRLPDFSAMWAPCNVLDLVEPAAPAYTPDEECLLTTQQLKAIRARAALADDLAAALAEAKEQFRIPSDSGYICTMCNRRIDAHTSWCRVPHWAAALDKYNALGGDE